MEPELIDLINDWGFGWDQVLNYLIFDLHLFQF